MKSMTTEARQSIRVFVVDDHPMIRHGLAAMVQAERELKWLGDAGETPATAKTHCVWPLR